MNKKTFLLTFILGTAITLSVANYCSADIASAKPISDVLDDAIEWLLTVASIISILVVVIGGIIYVSSSGNPDTAKTAKKIVNGGILGVIICGLAYGILAVIDEVLNT